MKRLISILALCFLTALPAQGAVPKLMTYQGVLKDSSGNFLTGTYSMTFRIYAASAGGSVLWSETQPSVSTSSGKFSVQLGSVTALNLDFNSDYWLSMQVGADAEMSPRIRLTSMGYGIRADYENNGFTQAQHDALSHKNVEGVRDNTVNISKTNFKLDAYSVASANSMGDMIIDTFNDSSGVSSGSSSNYTWRGSSDFDVVLAQGGIDSYAKLVLHGNGTDASTTFTDSSSGEKVITGFGNVQIDTAQSKFGGASVLFDGASDYLSIPYSTDWSLGAVGTGNDWTIDWWTRFNSVGNDTYFYCDGATGWSFGRESNSLFYFHSSAGWQYISWTPPTGVWIHLAVVKSGTTITFYQNGTSLGTFSDANMTNTGNALRIGSDASPGAYDMDGWMDEIRITKGVARWTSNFTPPSAEYANPSGSATVISNAYSEPVAPTEAIVIADETLGTGSIVYYVSRDNGTTWTQCTKETVTNISSQPSGTQLKWKAIITGNAELNAIAVAV